MEPEEIKRLFIAGFAWFSRISDDLPVRKENPCVAGSIPAPATTFPSSLEGWKREKLIQYIRERPISLELSAGDKHAEHVAWQPRPRYCGDRHRHGSAVAIVAKHFHTKSQKSFRGTFEIENYRGLQIR